MPDECFRLVGVNLAPMHPPLLACTALCTLLTLTSQSPAARAASDQPRVTVLPFGGDTGRDVQRAVSKVVARHGYRLVSTDDVGNAALSLCSDLGAAVTGETIYVDAGFNIMGMPSLDKPPA